MDSIDTHADCCGMQQKGIRDVDAAQRYDTPRTGMFAPDVSRPTGHRLAELAGATG